MIRLVVAFILAVAVSAGEGPKILELTISPLAIPLNGTEVFATARFYSPSGKEFQHDWKLLYDGKDEGVIGVKMSWPTKVSENEYNVSASFGPIRAGNSISFEVSNVFGSDKKEVKLRVGEPPKILELTISPDIPLSGTEVLATVRFRSPTPPLDHDWKLRYNGNDEVMSVVKMYWPTKLSENEYNASASLGPIRAGNSISFEVINEFGSDKKEVKFRVGVGYNNKCDDASNGTAVCANNTECRNGWCVCRKGYEEAGQDVKTCHPKAWYGEYCNSTIGLVCIRETECDSTVEKCLCRQGYYWNSFYSNCIKEKEEKEEEDDDDDRY